MTWTLFSSKRVMKSSEPYYHEISTLLIKWRCLSSEHSLMSQGPSLSSPMSRFTFKNQAKELCFMNLRIQEISRTNQFYDCGKKLESSLRLIILNIRTIILKLSKTTGGEGCPWCAQRQQWPHQVLTIFKKLFHTDRFMNRVQTHTTRIQAVMTVAVWLDLDRSPQWLTENPGKNLLPNYRGESQKQKRLSKFRARMETMERQLAGLSNLVHSALVSKGMSENTQRDMAELRREVSSTCSTWLTDPACFTLIQILSMHPDTARESSEEPASSISDSISSHTAYQLSIFRNKLKETHNDLKQLKISAQVHTRSFLCLIKTVSVNSGQRSNCEHITQRRWR